MYSPQLYNSDCIFVFPLVDVCTSFYTNNNFEEGSMAMWFELASYPGYMVLGHGCVGVCFFSFRSKIKNQPVHAIVTVVGR